MADNVETLEPTASEEVLEQPVEQAEVEATEVEATETPEAEATETATETPATPRRYADKYDSPEDLERAYREQNAEASRMAARLAQYERGQSQPVTPKAEAPKYTNDQLEGWKETRLREVAAYQNMAGRFEADGNLQEARRYDSLAAESARQIRMIDAELRKNDIQATMGASTRQAAEQRLVGDAVNVVKQYASDLVPGTPLYEKASEFLSGYKAMGLDTESPLVQAQSVAMAAQILGLSSKKVAQSTRKELATTINQRLKEGVVAGAGKAAKSAAAPSFMDMTDDQFIAWKAKRGMD